MRTFFHSFLFPLLGCLLLFSCGVKQQITPEHIKENQHIITGLTTFMQTNQLDSLSKKNCTKELQKSFRKLKVERIEKAYVKLCYCPDKVGDIAFEFTNSGGFFHYRQSIYVIPQQSKEKYNINELSSNYEKVNDTIYLGTWPFIALM